MATVAAWLGRSTTGAACARASGNNTATALHYAAAPGPTSEPGNTPPTLGNHDALVQVQQRSYGLVSGKYQEGQESRATWLSARQDTQNRWKVVQPNTARTYSALEGPVAVTAAQSGAQLAQA